MNRASRAAKTGAISGLSSSRAESIGRLPVISTWDDPAREKSVFKDDGDIRLFSGGDDIHQDDDGGMKLFRDD